MKNENRIRDVDFAKGAGVFLMVIGHLGSICPDYIHSWIYSFHMPLFFFCSGIFAKQCSDFSALKYVIRRRIKSLVLPYFIYAVFFLLFDGLIRYKAPDWGDVIDILMGNDPFGFLWFIYALFFVSVIFSVSSLACGRKQNIMAYCVIGLSVAGLACNKLGVFERAGSILYSVGFYYLGAKCKQLMQGRSELGINRWVLAGLSVLVSFAGTYVLILLSGNTRMSIDIHHNVYPDILLTYVIALAGIFLLLLLSQMMQKCGIIYNFVAIVGMESLIVYPLFTYLPLRLEHIVGIDSGIVKLVTKMIAAGICVIVIIIRNNFSLYRGKVG